MTNQKRFIRVALLIPHTDTTLERDLQRSVLDNVSIHTERMWLKGVTVEDEQRMLDEEVPRAVKYLTDIAPDFAIFGCTSAGALHGEFGDRTLAGSIGKVLNCPTITAFGSVLQELRLLKLRKLAVITPYIPSVTAKITKGLADSGLEVSFSAGMGKVFDVETGAIEPEQLIQFVKQYESEMQGSDGLFISCTNLRAFECKAALESYFQVPVVTSNSAIISQLNKLILQFPHDCNQQVK